MTEYPRWTLGLLLLGLAELASESAGRPWPLAVAVGFVGTSWVRRWLNTPFKEPAR